MSRICAGLHGERLRVALRYKLAAKLLAKAHPASDKYRVGRLAGGGAFGAREASVLGRLVAKCDV